MKQADSPPHVGKPKFELGQLVVSPGVLKDVSPLECGEALARHVAGDWGELCKEEWKQNELALARNGELLSRYYTEDGTAFWVFTEAHCSFTTVLLLDEILEY